MPGSYSHSVDILPTHPSTPVRSNYTRPHTKDRVYLYPLTMNGQPTRRKPCRSRAFLTLLCASFLIWCLILRSSKFFLSSKVGPSLRYDKKVYTNLLSLEYTSTTQARLKTLQKHIVTRCYDFPYNYKRGILAQKSSSLALLNTSSRLDKVHNQHVLCRWQVLEPAWQQHLRKQLFLGYTSTAQAHYEAQKSTTSLVVTTFFTDISLEDSLGKVAR